MKQLSSIVKWLMKCFFSYGEILRLMLVRPWVTLLFIIAVTIAFAWHIPKISFNTTIYDLVIEDLPENINYENFKKIFGSNEIIRVVIKSDDVFDTATFKRIGILADEVKKIDGIQRVVSLPGIKKSLDISNKWTLEEFAVIVENAALFKKNLISEDRKTTALTLVLKNDALEESVIRDIQALISNVDKRLTLYQIGIPLVSSALAEFTQKDFINLPVITFLLMAMTLLLIYRNIFYLFLPISCVIILLVWTFGMMALTMVPLSILTMIIPVFLIAVCTAYCLHILSEYLSTLEVSKTSKDAVIKTFSKITFPTILTVMTTIIGLGSLMLNRISAIRQFSIIACFGVASLLIIVLTWLPALMAVTPQGKIKKSPESDSLSLLDRLIEKIIQVNLHHQKTVFSILAVVSIICVFGVFQIRVETNPVGYFKSDTQISKNFHDIYKDLSGSFPINVVMKGNVEDYFETPDHVSSVAKLQQFLETLPGVDKTISFADYMKLVNYTTNRFEKEYYMLPEEEFEVSMLLNSYKTILGEDMLTSFMSPDFSQANILLLTHISSASEFLEIRRKILDHVRKNFSKDLVWDVTGIGISISASNHQLTMGQVKSLSLTIFMIFVIMFALFLSTKVGLVAIVPNLFPILINFGIMGWFGIELSMATSLIATIAIGLAVDDTIHYLVRYNYEFRKDLDEKRALRVTIRHIARPIIFTTLTIIIGFSVLGFSNFQPTAVFGMMMVITMVSALIGDLILLPSLILHVNLVTVWDLVRIKLGMEPRHGIPLFHGLSRIQLHYIMLSAVLKKVYAGEVLFHKSDPSDMMYAIISGRLSVYAHEVARKGSSDVGHEMRRLVAECKSGEIIGEMGFIRSVPRSATVIATEPSELLHINFKAIQRLHWISPPAAIKFNANLLTILCDRLDKSTSNLYAEVRTDDLTQIYNRKYFIQKIEKEIKRARRYNKELSFLMIDIDYFKELNEEHGHQAGDVVLIKIAGIVRINTREVDIVARYGGGQIVVILPETNDVSAVSVAERIRKGVEKEEFFITESKKIHMTCSFGVSGLNRVEKQDKNNHVVLIKLGEQALYHAMQGGRNQTVKA